MPKPSPWTEEDIQRIVYMYTKENRSIVEIQRIMGKGCNSSVKNVMIKHNIPIRTVTEALALQGAQKRGHVLDEAQICKDYTQQNSMRSICWDWGITPYLVKRILETHNIPLRDNSNFQTRTSSNTSELEQEVVDLYQAPNYMSIPRLAERYNRSCCWVRGILKRWGIKKRTNSESVLKEKTFNIDDAVVKYKEGWGANVIGDFYHVSATFVKQKLKKAGVTLRSHIAAANTQHHLIVLNASKTKLHGARNRHWQNITNREEWLDFENMLKKMPGRSLLYWAKRYGVCIDAVRKRAYRAGLRECLDFVASAPNNYWASLVEDVLGIKPQWQNWGGEYHGFTNFNWSVDLWFPEQRVGVDINPTYTHSTQQIIRRNWDTRKSVTYHQERALDAERNGWLLYQIYDWDNTRLVLQQLKHLLGLDTERYYARKCSIVYPDENIVRQFLREHHRQQDRAIGSVYVGLEYQGDLVGVMTFGAERFRKGHTKAEQGNYELIRLATHGTVVGGASRMFRYFVNTYNPLRVKTFASLDSGHGGVYGKLGFKFERLAALNALYSKPDTPYAYKVTTCKDKFKTTYTQMSMTQQEYMNALGFYRINDAGNKVFIWTKGN